MKSICSLMSLLLFWLLCTAGVSGISAQMFSTAQGESYAQPTLDRSRGPNANPNSTDVEDRLGQDEDVLRIDTDLTNLVFTATDKQNRFITTLREKDIRVVEDGVTQKVFTFERETDRLLSIAFLIDVSASQEHTLPQEKAAARSFIETIFRSGNDEAALIAFAGDAFLEQPLTGNATDLYQAFERIKVAMPSYPGSGRKISRIASRPGRGAAGGGSTAIWDTVAVTSGEVLKPSSDKRRRVIILLTDGHDSSSRLNSSEAIDRALKAEAVIYTIGIGDSKQYEGIDKYTLSTVAERTGGRAFFPETEADLNAAFKQLEQELRSQYLIAYSSTNKRRDGMYRWTRIEITNPELRKAQIKLTYRPGYFAKGNSKSTGGISN